MDRRTVTYLVFEPYKIVISYCKEALVGFFLFCLDIHKGEQVYEKQNV